MSMPVRWGHRQPARWDPFSAEDWFPSLARWFDRPGAGTGDEWTPPADLEETETHYLVHAELPGVKREDVTVDLDDRDLEISGEAREPDREGRVHHHTRRIGRFSYRLRLPGTVDVDTVRATLSDGVLTVALPKSGHVKGSRIEVTEA